MRLQFPHQPRDRHTPIRAVQVTATVAAAAYAAHSVLGFGPVSLFENWVYNGVIVAGAALALLRAVCSREDRRTWAILGTGLGCWAAGELLYTLNPSSVDAGSFPATSDLLWLAFYPAGYVTLVLLVRGRVRRFYPSLWLDGLLGTLTLFALTAQFIFPAIVDKVGTSGGSVVADLIYPIGDSLLLIFVIGVLAVTGWRPGRRLALVSAGFALGAAADSWSLYWSATGHSGSTALDVLWPTSALLLGSAAWARDRGRVRVRLEGFRLLVLPVAFALTALGLLSLSGITPIHTVAYALALATLAGVIVRMAATFSENLKLAAHNRHEALTDPLTALPNRRQLLLDLEDAVADASPERPYRLALFDLNGFKGYNDTFGHPAGDALLIRLARRLAETLSGHGRAYRLGGDEFCVLLGAEAPATDLAVAQARAALSDRGNGREVSAAFGVAQIPGEAHDVESALRVADERLYAHKRRRHSIDFESLTVGEKEAQCR